MDQQLSLINHEQQKLKKTRTTNQPYLINSFNTHFDHSLKQLVLDYRFDFDKIALHLYYQFPQYQQRITSRTVGFRWWQIQAERKLSQEGGNLTQMQTKQSSQLNKKQEEESVELFSLENMFPFSQQKPFYPQPQFQPHSTTPIQNYSKALLNSQILTQQQSQRFILYKPKFIIDTQYQLQRYEVDMDAWRNSEMSRNDENMSDVMIEKLLKKVVDNQFLYDQFGGFGGCGDEIKRSEGNGDSCRNSEMRRIQWWVEEQQSSSQQECESGEQDELENDLLQFVPANSNVSKLLASQQQQNQKQDDNKLPVQLYDLEENWDEYESD